MSLDTIKEFIALDMDMRCLEIWGRILDNTDPGHYGVEDIECQVASSDIWVDIQKRTFTFRDATLTFNARLGATKDGIDKHCQFTVTGSGSFDFLNDGNGGIKVNDFTIQERLDLIGGKR